MSTFFSTLGQMAFLFVFIALGYFLVKIKVLPEGSEVILSKLESYVFIPCLVMNAFMNDFTVDKFKINASLIVVSTVFTLISAFIAVPLGKLFAKDDFTQKICIYGLAVANLGFMGNAVVKAIFPEFFSDYLVFCIPLNVAIYIWGVPVLLMYSGKKGIGERLKSFLNPMFVGIILGIVLGLLGARKYFPEWAVTVLESGASCMSPCAMLLTGMTVSKISLKKAFTGMSIYALSAVRLLVLPLVYILVMKLLPVTVPENIYISGLCAVSMPLGLNMVVVPAAYGRDTRIAASMAIVSHLLSCITIPIIFMLALIIQ